MFHLPLGLRSSWFYENVILLGSKNAGECWRTNTRVMSFPDRFFTMEFYKRKEMKGQTETRDEGNKEAQRERRGCG